MIGNCIGTLLKKLYYWRGLCGCILDLLSWKIVLELIQAWISFNEFHYGASLFHQIY